MLVPGRINKPDGDVVGLDVTVHFQFATNRAG